MDVSAFGTLAQGFIPHGHCYLWTPGLVLLHAGSDALIGLAYVAIPIALLMVVRQRQDLPFSWMFVLFGVFIVACGLTHLVEIWNIWNANFWFSGGVKFVTAAASIPTAYMLFRLLPTIRSMPTRDDLVYANRGLENANYELEQFSSAVSHDLRAPLRRMSGFSEALKNNYSGQLDEQGQHYLDRIQEASQGMEAIIDDLLSLSRLQREALKEETVDLSRIAEQIVSELREADAERRVEVDIQSGLMLRGDASMLTMALKNLLSNAWKFSKERSQARIRVGETTVEGQRVIYVNDNGVGFDMSLAHKVFDPFQRLHGESGYPGTGIGLTIVDRIIRKHGGEIWPESQMGEGSTFYFTTESRRD